MREIEEREAHAFAVQLVDTQLLETADPEELYVSIVNLATVGDYMEKELSKDKKDVF